jgi:hypothetical protein
METYNIYEAKTHLSELLHRAANGETIIIARAGKPQAMLSPIALEKPKRVSGLGKGTIWASPDAFSPELDAEIADEFNKSEIFPSMKNVKAKKNAPTA